MINTPVPLAPIVDGSQYMNPNFRGWTQSITRTVNAQTIITGSGSPEGVVVGDITQMYMNSAGTSGAILWIKKTGTGNTGWILV